MILVKFGSGRFGFSGRSECAPEIYQRQFRLHFVSARQAAFTRRARARRGRSAIKKTRVFAPWRLCVKTRLHASRTPLK